MRRVSKGRGQRLWVLYIGSHGHQIEGGDKKDSAINRLVNPTSRFMVISSRIH